MQILKFREKIFKFCMKIFKILWKIFKNLKNPNFSQQKFKNFQNFFENSFFHLLAVCGHCIIISVSEFLTFLVKNSQFYLYKGYAVANIFKMQSFKGQISKVKKEVLTHTSGEIKSTEIKTKYSLFFDKQIISGGGGGGKVQTTHEHYTNFKIDKVSFRCGGDYSFDDGDEVMIYANQTNQGFYEVILLKNTTSNFIVNHFSPSNPIIAALGAFFLSGFFSWIALVIVSIFIDLFIGVDKQSTLYMIWENGVIIVALLIGLWFGKIAFQTTKDENAIFHKAYKEIQNFNG